MTLLFQLDGEGILLEFPSTCFLSFIVFGLSVERIDGVLLYISEHIQVM